MEIPQNIAKKTTKVAAKGKRKMIEHQPHDLQRRIAEAAYYRAQQRGFAAGNDLEDWFLAEKQVGH